MPPWSPTGAPAKFFEREFGITAVKILPGEFYATKDGMAIVTVLGSCVSVCLFDLESGVGGMNHFLLPQAPKSADPKRCANPGLPPCPTPCSTRYGACALKRLVERLDQLGARRNRLQAKIFGAGRVMKGSIDIGGKNAAFAINYLHALAIPIVASDTGKQYPRKLIFFPATGKVLVKRLSKQPEESYDEN